ncbi:MAG: hypothetical protein AAB375_01425 [Patescibacteria group bacterium]
MRKVLSTAFACLILTLLSQVAPAQPYTTRQELAVPHYQLERGGSLDLPFDLGTIKFLGLKINPVRIAYRMDLNPGTEEVLSDISTCGFGETEPYRQEWSCHSWLKHDDTFIQFSFEFTTMYPTPKLDDAVYVRIATSDRRPSSETVVYPKEIRVVYNLGGSPLEWGSLPIPSHRDSLIAGFAGNSLFICDARFDLDEITVCTESGAHAVIRRGTVGTLHIWRTSLQLSWQGGHTDREREGGGYDDILLTITLQRNQP